MVEAKRWWRGSELGKCTLVLLPLVLGLAVLVGARSAVRAAPYNDIGILKGQVVVQDPGQGKVPAPGNYFVLERVDCRRCLVGVRTDARGRYEVFVGVGRYRLYCDDPEGERMDLLAKTQQREVTVQKEPNSTEFNIELVVPPGGH